MILAHTQHTRKQYLELSNLTTNRKLYNMYLDLYLRACRRELKKAVAATTA